MENDHAPVILLAGGKSSRLGQPKGLVLVQGRPWLEAQLERIAAAGLREAIVVLGFEQERYQGELPWLEQAIQGTGAAIEGMRVRCALNPRPEYGPFSSIQAGARVAQESARAPSFAWVLPIDVPCPNAKVWQRLSASRTQVSVPVYQGRGGHPVRLSREFMGKLLVMAPDAPDARLDLQIRNLGPQADRIEVDDPSVLKNLNLPSDWAGFS